MGLRDDRALAEDGDRFAALQLDPSQRAPGRAGAAGDGGPVTKESESGSGTSVDTGTFMYFAWPP
jgi:hypothetical protein